MTVYVEGVILHLTPQTGALVVYGRRDMRGKKVDIWTGNLSNLKTFSANMVEREINGQRVFAAVFPRLPAGDYDIKEDFSWHLIRRNFESEVTVFPGEVAEVDWR